MNSIFNPEKIKFTEKITVFIKKDILLVIALTLAIVSSFFSMPKLEYIDFKVLVLLFNLMLIVAAFKRLKVLDCFATSLLSKCTSHRSISFTLIFLTFFSSMIVTNDVALITFVPLTLVIGKKIKINPFKIIIFQTIAANLGSSLTPMGNPQNLFIYSFFKISPLEFFKITIPLVVLSTLFLIAIIFKSKNKPYSFTVETIKISNLKEFAIYLILLLIILLSVFHVIDYKITFIFTISTVFFLNKKLFKLVDYSLLLTFICFFIFIGNISSMDYIKNIMETILSSSKSTYFSSIIVSQGISNVPATMLISGFTPYYKELLLGVNIGGLGTLIASLASVISYKLYIKEYPESSKDFLKSFTLYNLCGLLILVPLIYFINKI
ncbi:MAG: SLC13 family permease [Clostridium sp.]|jgi:Na+/H+ antiporter NhaD/arsenite permease-like protein|nr:MULTISPECIES: SLC13 family permease [Clostridium]MBS5306736.1 anion permease [Clostridium sp.]MDB1944763.1 SLC13 family permease [Clostridium tertium]MDB1952056.1 SLC13 family permease [Clostridium tertium]MDB1968951.1 SLC13 family permease [Clostridium tertium]MDU1277493.1 SLC13 family permease [Clostridium sp.]